MTLQEAIVARHSVRQYATTPIEAEKLSQLREAISEANRTEGLHLQLVTDEPQAFASGLAKYGKFSGVRNYIAVVGRKGMDTLVGYHAERVVLLAQSLGLNSCWVGLTFKNQPDHYQVANDEKLYCLVAFGYGLNHGVAHKVRPVEDFCKVQGAMPDWFRRGMEAAVLAPTAMNLQKFEFELLPDGKQVAARTRFALMGTYLKLDLGIVKCHFEIGAGAENFSWAE